MLSFNETEFVDHLINYSECDTKAIQQICNELSSDIFLDFHSDALFSLRLY